MADGLILLVVLAVLTAYFVTRARRRMGLVTTGRTWVTVIVGFVLVVLALWAAATQH
ncbi:MAG: hypothetical protein ACLPN6_17180 [Streptosporangiaceae bacterium]